MSRRTLIEGRAVVLDRDNIDTDQIIPVRFLIRTREEGYADALFANLRRASNAVHASDLLAMDDWNGAKFLIAGKNFGCGSSREQAAWALLDYGFKVVVAESFSGIFLNNAFKNGLVAVALESSALDRLKAMLGAVPKMPVRVDIETQEVVAGDGFRAGFEIDAFWQDCLVRGGTEADVTKAFAEQIDCFERARMESAPWIFHRGRTPLTR